jgi:hypothetical protein
VPPSAFGALAMPHASILEFAAAIIAFGPRAGHDALLGLLGMSALIPAEICAHLAVLLTGIGGGAPTLGEAQPHCGSQGRGARSHERQGHESSDHRVLGVRHGRFPKAAHESNTVESLPDCFTPLQLP